MNDMSALVGYGSSDQEDAAESVALRNEDVPLYITTFNMERC